MPARNLTTKLIDAHRVDEKSSDGELALRMDQTLTQDATGTLVMLELEAMGFDRVRTQLSAQYVDHNLIQADHKNPDDHEFLRSACARYGVWFSRPGNGVSHPLHMQQFGKPGLTLVGSDSHTPAAGSLGMLAFGAGGIDVALAMAGEPLHLERPRVWGVELRGSLPDWVSAKDVILELLRRHGVDGGRGYVIEYHGAGLEALSAMDRHVIANMGTELGATSSLFPSDGATRKFLETVGRADDFTSLAADPGCRYDREETLDLDALEPLVARPSSPGDVVPVTELAGAEIHQAYLGSSANPGYRDFAVAARMLEGRRVADGVSLDVNPTSRRLLEALIADGLLANFIQAGARLHQAGCNGCIGMGQAPATGRRSLRTVPRNFPGRSGTREDSVYLCSPETAIASALTGAITDPRSLGLPRVSVGPPPTLPSDRPLFTPPPAPSSRRAELRRGPNIVPLPALDPLPDTLTLPVLLKLGDDISTDEICPAGGRALPFRSNIPRIADFAFDVIDESYAERARATRDAGGHAVIAGDNYGQGSSREHAALAPRSLGLRLVLARSFARIHWQNLVNFGVLPLRFTAPEDLDRLEPGTTLRLGGLHRRLPVSREIRAELKAGRPLILAHDLSPRQVTVLLAGGAINGVRRRAAAGAVRSRA